MPSAAKNCLVGLVLGVALSACTANENSIYRSNLNDANETILIDAKQRAINVQTRDEGKGKIATTICAEKSPDAFSVLSAGASGSLSFQLLEKAFGGAVTGSKAETGASIALRTQLTQAQSEFLYRLCELRA